MTKKYVAPLYAGLTAAGLIGLVPAAAMAQEKPEIAQAATGTGLEEIVVTAQKRVENIQEVPIAIEAFNEHMIDSLQITNLDSLGQSTPGLEITRVSGSVQFVLRGIGGFGITPGIEPNIALFLDGVYLPLAASGNFNFNNVDHIEVDKGPQGTLFGRNAVGGAIQITTKEPSQTPHIDAQIGYANYDTISGQFYGTTGITDTLTADLAVYGTDQMTGWGKDLYDTSIPVHIDHEYSARTKWVFRPTDTTKFTFITDFDRSVTNMYGSSFINGVFSTITQGPKHVGGFYDFFGNEQPHNENRQYGGSVKMEHDFGWAEGTSLTSWRRDNFYNHAGSTITIAPASGPQIAGIGITPARWLEQTATEEAQLLAPASSTLKWIGGVYLYEDHAAADPGRQYGFLLNSATPATSPLGKLQTITNDWQNTQSYAAYGQATAPVMPDTRLTLGYRYTIDKRNIYGLTINTLPGTVGVVGSIAANALNNPSGTSKVWYKSTYKLSLDHDFAENVLGYASYSRGFESGAYNVVAGPMGAAVNPETLDAYEVGVKSDLLDKKLRFNAAAFYYTFNNIVVTQFLLTSPTSLNAARAIYKGIDLDVQAAPTRNLTIQAGLNLLDPYYESFPGAVFYTYNPTTLGWSTAPGNASHNQVSYTEKVQGNVAAQYRIPTDMGDFQIAGDVQYHGGTVFDPQNLLRQQAYFLLDGNIMWTAPNGQYDVKLWGKNLTNLKYPAVLSISGTAATYLPGPPLSVGINLGYHWN